ncbi:hypothetical protein [Pedobacter foliorum]|uniref:hypothetical protein n=1 Tax=Pedobacter foliorum TaxID=2739058 RepID=UPI001565B63B|nr:hypothetical protein [Pedobacter foliorum]NRF37550.1 hypothetical protein [Pedobacter foliorum]
MKFKLTLLLVCLCYFAKAQKTIRLDDVDQKDTINTERAVIYGTFVQRLNAMTSGGLNQEIYLRDTATQELYVFRAKPLFKSAKQHNFIFFIKPGTYAIVEYMYQKSTWYGFKQFEQQIRKPEGSLYLFTLAPGSINELGTWHFEKEKVSFENTAEAVNEKLKQTYQKLDFTKTVQNIPR